MTFYEIMKQSVRTTNYNNVKKGNKIEKTSYFFYYKGERRDLNPRVVESQSTALPLGYARHIFYYITSIFNLST